VTDLHSHKSFGAILRALRVRRGYSLRQLAKKAYLGKSLIERYERGSTLPPSRQTIECLIRALGCSKQEVFAVECAWLIDLLISRGIERERAKAMILSEENTLAPVDIGQVLWMADEAIKHDAFDKALQWLEPIRTMHYATQEVLPLLEYRLGEAKYGSGYLAEAGDHFKEALRRLGFRLPAVGPRSILSLCRLGVRQFWNRVRPTTRPGAPGHVQEANQIEKRRQIIIDACYRLSHICYINNQRDLALYYSLQGLNIAEEFPALPASHNYQALFAANLATVAGFTSLHSLARVYINLANSLEKRLDDPRASYGVDLVLGVYSFGRAQWEECEARFERAARIAEQQGHLRHARESQAFLASAYCWQGRWNESFALFDQLYQKARQCGDSQIMASACYSKALHALQFDRLDHALKFAQIAECLARERSQDRLAQIQANGLLLEIYACQNQIDQAHLHARVIEDLSRLISTTAGTLEGYYRLSEYYLRVWQTSGSLEFRAAARKAVRRIAVHARIFDVFRPLYWTYRGWYEFLSGKRDKGMQLVAQGVREAQTLKMTHHESLARQCLADLSARV